MVKVIRLFILLLCSLMAFTSCALAEQSNVNCDKGCLFDVTELYLEAMTSGNPARLPLSPDLRVTSNSELVALGGGATWQPGITINNRYTFVDPDTRTSIFFGTVAGKPGENRTWWHLSFRLSLDAKRRIVEIEEQSNTSGFQTADKVEMPFKEAAIFASVLPKDERVSRSELIDAADSYWDALTTGEGGEVPFGPDCQRTEFGSYSTNNPYTHDERGNPDYVAEPKVGKSCRTFFKGEKFRWRTDNRRYYVADEARGVVVAVGQLHRFGAEGIPGLTLIEAFKIINGRIQYLWVPAFNWGLEESAWPDWNRPSS